MTESKIPLDILRKIKTIVTHAHCPDGLASAILLHDALPDAEILFCTHDQLDALPITEGMLFCDIAPTPKRAMDFLEKHAVVLDHHKTAQGVVAAFVEDGLGVYADNGTEPGVSGAVLACRHVWRHLKRKATLRPLEGEIEIRNAEAFAELVGIRDTFDKRNAYKWEIAWNLSAGMMFQPAEALLRRSDVFWPDEWNEWFYDTRRLGEIVETNTRRRAKRAVSEGFLYTAAKDHLVLIVQGLDLTTTIGDSERNLDLIVGFQYRTDPVTHEPRFQVSMRSQGVVDVAAIAKAYGGGGHTNAAGFTIPLVILGIRLEFDPILKIQKMLEEMGV